MNISISDEGIERLVNKIKGRQIGYFSWDTGQFLQSTDLQEIANYFFIGNSINFCFWSKTYQNRFSYGPYTGSGAMWLALCDNIAIMRTDRLPGIDLLSVGAFRDIQLCKERETALREVGSVLAARFHGDIVNLCEQSNWDALTIVDNIRKHFPLWIDEHNGIRFDKRARLFVAMLHGRLGMKSPVKNCSLLGCLADYQLPKVLSHHRVLLYSAHLAGMINAQRILEHNGEEELEIRVKTADAMNLICEKLVKIGLDVCPLQLDYVLWNEAKTIDWPHHLTITTAY